MSIILCKRVLITSKLLPAGAARRKHFSSSPEHSLQGPEAEGKVADANSEEITRQSMDMTFDRERQLAGTKRPTRTRREEMG